MASLENHQAYRFVVVYRSEPREIPGAESCWRGWVASVPETEKRIGFNDLEELPEIIRGWVHDHSKHRELSQDRSKR